MKKSSTVASVASPFITGEGATRALAAHAVNLQYDALPAALVELIKQCVLDTLGVAIGASGLAPEAKLVADYVRDMGGRPEATLWGYGERAPAAWAAFVNGGLGHMLDYDDVGAGGHVSIATIPVAFAVAEKQGGVSGRDLIAAVAAGTDLHTRMSLGVTIPDWTITEGWFPTQLFGFISGAATAGKLLRLDEDQMENALGAGFNQASGSRQMAVGAATHMRSMQAGFSGQGAILAAELARRGIVGSKQFLEGRYGVYNTYIRAEKPDWNAIVGELGTRFPLLDKHGFKVWPACGYTRATNTAILHLREKHKLKPADVATLTVVGGTGATKLLSEPLARKRRPQLSIDAKFSIPFTSAVAMVHGGVALRHFTDGALRDPAVLSMADRVSYREETNGEVQFGGDSTTSRPTVEIRTVDGRVLSHRPDGMPGDPRNPVSTELLETKFRDCMSFAAKPVAADRVESAIKLIRRLETVADVAEIIRLLS
ncbi:MAG: MmgE/PrpD family protein [Burkholderiales bacterium]